MVLTVIKYKSPQSNRKESIQVVTGEDFETALEKIFVMYPDFISVIYEKSKNQVSSVN